MSTVLTTADVRLTIASMTKQSIATKNRVDRVRRQVEKGIQYCKENQITLQTGDWMSGTSVCALGAVLLHEGTQNSAEGNWVAAAKSLRITELEVGAFVDGFDAPEQEVWYTGRAAAMNRLGIRINRKYGPL